MNDKELFWSLIGPHLVDRPDAYSRINWGIEYIMEDTESKGVNWDFQRFIKYNHTFRMPSNLQWREDFTPYTSKYDSLTLKNYPHSMIITQDKASDKNAMLYFILNEVIIVMSLTQMHNSKTEYAIGTLNNILDFDYTNYFTIGKGKYAIYKSWPKFVNWINDPLEVKS